MYLFQSQLEPTKPQANTWGKKKKEYVLSLAHFLCANVSLGKNKKTTLHKI
jgi:hypothetical protein